MKDDLEKSFAFILELEKLKAVQRKIKPLGLQRYENSAEHSWQAALMALVLARYADEKVDAEKAVKMLLVHDIGEIDADDVFFFDENGRAEAKDKELKAVERLCGLLPEAAGSEILGLWKEFEYGETKEAKFARAIDRLMPVLQNLHNNRQSWMENGVKKEQILSRTAYIGDAGAVIWEMLEEKIHLAFEPEERN
jgi:putative hydrolase of HD superfamily